MMRLPNAVNAVIDLEKIRDYCLNPDHPRGKHKARVFESVFGFRQSDSSRLLDLIAVGIVTAESDVGERDDFGARFTTDIEIRVGGCVAVVRTAWIVRTGEDFPRLTTCYLK